ncbi:MAG: nitrous oxide reductase accessory protein NosL [Gammaproteobacteria bacterium]|nr:nitrous oxide reductase accessory protein NosL [Gammaproteobacteria bacterium]
MIRKLRVCFILALISGVISSSVLSEPLKLPGPGPRDTCPVCGMFVAKYPEWVATVTYPDGHAHHFDGAKDLFKYLGNLSKWAPGHDARDIVAIGVTEYYGLKLIDAREAYYVTGSDVLGPMGHELIPLETRLDADEFMSDHKGKSMMRFHDIELKTLEMLDRGAFE